MALLLCLYFMVSYITTVGRMFPPLSGGWSARMVEDLESLYVNMIYENPLGLQKSEDLGICSSNIQLRILGDLKDLDSRGNQGASHTI